MTMVLPYSKVSLHMYLSGAGIYHPDLIQLCPKVLQKKRAKLIFFFGEKLLLLKEPERRKFLFKSVGNQIKAKQ